MKTYKLNSINKVKNEKTHFDFPVLYPNKEYFNQLQTVLNSYGIILTLLANDNYKIEEFISNLIENQEINAFAKENNFTVSIFEKENNNKGVLSERLINDDNEVILEAYYSNETFSVLDGETGSNYIVSLYVDFDILKIYFTGNYLYAEDKTTNKKYFIYLD